MIFEPYSFNTMKIIIWNSSDHPCHLVWMHMLYTRNLVRELLAQERPSMRVRVCGICKDLTVNMRIGSQLLNKTFGPVPT